MGIEFIKYKKLFKYLFIFYYWKIVLKLTGLRNEQGRVSIAVPIKQQKLTYLCNIPCAKSPGNRQLYILKTNKKHVQ